MHDVAQLAGVSIKTVSNVLNAYPHVRPETRSKVERAVEMLDYRINVSARNLRSGCTGVISLAIPELNQPYFAQLAESVIAAAAGFGLTALVEITGGTRAGEEAVLSGRRRNVVDGVIYSPIALGPADVTELSVDFPLVLLGERIFHGPVDHVTMANEEAAEAAVRHLIEDAGRRRIVLVGANSSGEPGVSTLRTRGSLAALAAAGIEPDPRLLVNPVPWTRAATADAVQKLLDDGVSFDGMFCFTDLLAFGALRALLRNGVRVPQDVALVGFDDVEDSQFTTPSLSSISPGRDLIAKHAVELLHARLTKGGPVRRQQEIVVPFDLRVRESSMASPTRADPGTPSRGSGGHAAGPRKRRRAP
jgi:DNA-binding LacI/PurR family transcriptional regulator